MRESTSYLQDKRRHVVVPYVQRMFLSRPWDTLHVIIKLNAKRLVPIAYDKT